MESVFEEWNIYAQRKRLIPRETDLNLIESDARLKIAAITGIRRAGKSSLLMLLAQKFVREGQKAAYIKKSGSDP